MVSLYSAKKGFLLNVVMVIHVLAFVFSDHWVNRRSQFTFMGHGDFLLYKNTERNFEVKCAFRFIVRTLNRNCVFIARFQQGCEDWEIKQKKLSFVAIFFFLFIGRKLTAWPANKCPQKMDCSCAMSSNFVWLQIIFRLCVNETTLSSLLRSLLSENGRLFRFPKIFLKKNKHGDRMIKQLSNSVIAKYRDLSVSRRSIICRSRIIDLLAADKSRYFA